MEISRRTFLKAAVGGAGLLTVGSCGRSSTDPVRSRPVVLRSAAELPPSPRPTLRLPGGDFGLPSPFFYLPPNIQRLHLIYDTLLSSDPTGTLLPWLASSYEPSPDGLLHRFQLRDNVFWHDGRPVTVDDVVFSFRYFREQEAAGELPPFLVGGPADVADARASGTGVEIRLDKPVVTFAPHVAGGFPIVPRHVWEPIEHAALAELPQLVGSGPYRLESYSGGKGDYLFSANDRFFLGRPYVRRVEMVAVGDQLAALEAGEIDVAGFQVQATPTRAIERFLADPSFGMVESALDAVVALHWNLARSGPLADVRFRRACAHAIDRKDMVKRLLGENGKPGNPGFLPPGHPFRVDVEQYPFDPAAAERLLDEAGYRRRSGGVRQARDGKDLRFALTVPVSLAGPAELVKRALGEVGVGLELDPTESGLRVENYQMALLFYAGVGGDPDYLRVYSSRGAKGFQGALGYADPEIDDLLDRQVVNHDETNRREMVARIQQIVARDIPILHLYYPTPFRIFRRSKFDQWPAAKAGSDSLKHPLVTGVGTGGTQIRPIAE